MKFHRHELRKEEISASDKEVVDIEFQYLWMTYRLEIDQVSPYNSSPAASDVYEMVLKTNLLIRTGLFKIKNGRRGFSYNNMDMDSTKIENNRRSGFFCSSKHTTHAWVSMNWTR